jgi:tetraacyldisaccharide 4'-kinase
VPGAPIARTLAPAVALEDWRAGRIGAAVPWSALQGRRLVAAAGIAAPERFFAMLEAAGLVIERLPLSDHHRFDTLPWPAATPEVVLTEKDAVKLDAARLGTTRVWVVGLDFVLPGAFVAEVLRRLESP